MVMTSNTTTTIIPMVIARRKFDSYLSTHECRQGTRMTHASVCHERGR